MIISASKIGENFLCSMVDITDRKQAEIAQMENLELLRATFNATPDGILAVNKKLKVMQANQQYFRMWRLPAELQKTDDDETLRAFILDQLEDPIGFKNKVDKLYHSRIQTVHEIPLKDGRIFECYSAPMEMNEKEIGRVWDFRDISKQKYSEAEREKLQSQLLQSQKLEAVGILAGGVAHDFNNMLGAIIGYSELTIDSMEAENPFRENILKVLEAAQRSAALIRQLLIFARKQNVTSAVFDMNESVENMLKMLQRLIGEDIELVWQPFEFPCNVKMDPSQLDQILANLCVNSRDAISDVGKITIKTKKVSFDDVSCRSYMDYMP
jgi:signal transduction histidine kinase